MLEKGKTGEMQNFSELPKALTPKKLTVWQTLMLHVAMFSANFKEIKPNLTAENPIYPNAPEEPEISRHTDEDGTVFIQEVSGGVFRLKKAKKPVDNEEEGDPKIVPTNNSGKELQTKKDLDVTGSASKEKDPDEYLTKLIQDINALLK